VEGWPKADAARIGDSVGNSVDNSIGDSVGSGGRHGWQIPPQKHPAAETRL